MTAIESKLAYEAIDSENPHRRAKGMFSVRYDDADPFVVRLLFCEEEPVNWIVGRSVLAAGLITHSGLSDIRISPTHLKMMSLEPAVTIEFSTPDGKAQILVGRRSLKMFLEQTYELVPEGTETFDVDALVDALLA